ncbi:imidazolonepropionase [candidate division KSB1 bacterium]|nr:imidazolonepropionase [candidate division KSB1 bacterium]
MKVDLFFKNARQLISPVAQTGGIGELQIIENAGIGCFQGKITAVGPTEKLQQEIELIPDANVIDVSNKLIAPAFVDPHTHPVFWGTRENEFVMRIEGKSYREIAEAGGGIRYSVRQLRKASEEQLIEASLPHLNHFLKSGTTTIEAKSGYGLTFEDELKSLRVLKKLNQIHPIEIIPTFLGAHEIPDEYRNNRRQYIDLLINEMIPQVTEEKLAEFCDVFCEEHVFTVDESREILTAAKDAGLELKIHADQLTAGGGSELAAELGAISADHLDHASRSAMELLKQHGVIPVLLPGAVFYLGLSRYAPAREMIELGLPVALATDFNPGSCMTQSMPIILTIACIYMKLLPHEALIAATLNAARAINRDQSIGSLEVGKDADFVILNIPNINYLPYHFGVNHVDKVVKKGALVIG